MTVCVLGSLNLDIIARVAALPRPGETVAAREVLTLPGGKGLNQAIAAARMGAGVRMVGAVGVDAAGEQLVEALVEAGVDAGRIARIADVPTGTAYISTDDAGENQIVVTAGANARVLPAAVDAAALGDATVFLAQLETPVATLAAFLAAAAGRGTRILNAAPALPDAIALFALAELLIVNETELATLCGTRIAASPEDAGALAAGLLTRADQAVIVTLGAAGALRVTRAERRLSPALRVAVVDTTGAGDCFCGALAALIAEGMPADLAMTAAGAAAALCVGRAGAAPAMPRRGEVDALLASNNSGAGDQDWRAPPPRLAEAPLEG